MNSESNRGRAAPGSRGESHPTDEPEISERALWSGMLTSRFSTRPRCYAPVSVAARRVHLGVFYRFGCAGRVCNFSDSAF